MIEYFDVVNEDDEIVGKATRDECHKKGMLHRSVHIIVMNSSGKMLLQKRSTKKDLYKGWWIDAAAGHVDSGETYEEAANREVKEELEIQIKLQELLTLRKKWHGNRMIDNELIKVYLGKHNGPFRFPKDEIEFVRFYKPKEVLKMLKKEKFTPGTRAIFREITKHPKLLKKLGLS